MQRHRFTFTLLAAMATLLARLAYSAAEVEQQATELERTSLLSAIGEGIILAVAIGFGAAILATFRKPTAKW